MRMANQGRVKVGIIGSQFQADIHAASFQIMPEEAEVVAVASPTPGNAAAFARKFGIPRVFTDYREMLKEKDIEMVTIAAPNSLHAQMTKDCAAAGKHIVCEKPLAMTIAEGEEMIAVAKRHGVLLMYGEELLFTPKYLKAKEMADAGAFGKIYLVKQSEKHFGPHSEWFWDVNRSGGGAFMDLGCHGIAFCYWFHGPLPYQIDLLPDGHLRSRRQDSSRRRFAMHPRVRERRDRVDREQLGAPRRHGRSHRGLRRGRRNLRQPAHGQRPAHLQRKRLRLRRREGPHHQRLDLSRSSRNSGTTARRKN